MVRDMEGGHVDTQQGYPSREQRNQHDSGFTLVELLVAMAVLLVLAAIVSLTIVKSQQATQVTTDSVAAEAEVVDAVSRITRDVSTAVSITTATPQRLTLERCASPADDSTETPDPAINDDGGCTAGVETVTYEVFDPEDGNDTVLRSAVTSAAQPEKNWTTIVSSLTPAADAVDGDLVVFTYEDVDGNVLSAPVPTNQLGQIALVGFTVANNVPERDGSPVVLQSAAALPNTAAGTRSLKIAPLAAPTLTATKTGDTVNLTWAPGREEDKGNITGWLLTRTTPNSGTLLNPTNSDSDQRTSTDSFDKGWVSACYRVYAVNDAGLSVASAEQCVTAFTLNIQAASECNKGNYQATVTMKFDPIPNRVTLQRSVDSGATWDFVAENTSLGGKEWQVTDDRKPGHGDGSGQVLYRFYLNNDEELRSSEAFVTSCPPDAAAVGVGCVNGQSTHTITYGTNLPPNSYQPEWWEALTITLEQRRDGTNIWKRLETTSLDGVGQGEERLFLKYGPESRDDNSVWHYRVVVFAADNLKLSGTPMEIMVRSCPATAPQCHASNWNSPPAALYKLSAKHLGKPYYAHGNPSVQWHIERVFPSGGKDIPGRGVNTMPNHPQNFVSPWVDVQWADGLNDQPTLMFWSRYTFTEADGTSVTGPWKSYTLRDNIDCPIPPVVPNCPTSWDQSPEQPFITWGMKTNVGQMQQRTPFPGKEPGYKTYDYNYGVKTKNYYNDAQWGGSANSQMTYQLALVNGKDSSQEKAEFADGTEGGARIGDTRVTLGAPVTLAQKGKPNGALSDLFLRESQDSKLGPGAKYRVAVKGTLTHDGSGRPLNGRAELRSTVWCVLPAGWTFPEMQVFDPDNTSWYQGRKDTNYPAKTGNLYVSSGSTPVSWSPISWNNRQPQGVNTWAERRSDGNLLYPGWAAYGSNWQRMKPTVTMTRSTPRMQQFGDSGMGVGAWKGQGWVPGVGRASQFKSSTLTMTSNDRSYHRPEGEMDYLQVYGRENAAGVKASALPWQPTAPLTSPASMDAWNSHGFQYSSHAMGWKGVDYKLEGCFTYTPPGSSVPRTQCSPGVSQSFVSTLARATCGGDMNMKTGNSRSRTAEQISACIKANKGKSGSYGWNRIKVAGAPSSMTQPTITSVKQLSNSRLKVVVLADKNGNVDTDAVYLFVRKGTKPGKLVDWNTWRGGVGPQVGCLAFNGSKKNPTTGNKTCVPPDGDPKNERCNPVNSNDRYGQFTWKCTFIVYTKVTGSGSRSRLSVGDNVVIAAQIRHSQGTESKKWDGQSPYAEIGYAGSPLSVVKSREIAPPAPGTPRITGVSSTKQKISATWNSKRYATSYSVQRRNVSNGGSWKDSGTTSSTSITIGGLRSDTVYAVRVKANGRGGSSSWSDGQRVRTKVGPPSAPRITSTSSTKKKISASWTKPANTNRFVVNYRNITGGGSWKSAGTTTSRSIVISGLKKNKKYGIRVQAKGSGGTSNWSGVASVRTKR